MLMVPDPRLSVYLTDSGLPYYWYGLEEASEVLEARTLVMACFLLPIHSFPDLGGIIS